MVLRENKSITVMYKLIVLADIRGLSKKKTTSHTSQVFLMSNQKLEISIRYS